DILHNIRSALDHLAYDLAAAHTGSLTAEMDTGSEFPIFLDEPKSCDPWKRRIGGIAPEAQSIIRELQPYRPRAFPVHGLEALYHLSNIDKHRRPTLAAHMIGEYSVWPMEADREFDLLETAGSVALIDYGVRCELARYRGPVEREGKRRLTVHLRNRLQ